MADIVRDPFLLIKLLRECAKDLREYDQQHPLAPDLEQAAMQLDTLLDQMGAISHQLHYLSQEGNALLRKAEKAKTSR